MTQCEMMDIVNSVPAINFDEVDAKDGLLLSLALAQFAGQIKPIVAKYADKMPENSTFLPKLQHAGGQQCYRIMRFATWTMR